MRSLLTAATALSLGSAAHAFSQICQNSDLCYSLSIPDITASSGKGDIYFQISAPTSYSWVALGEGTQMVGANIFVMYTSSDGKNVTVSPRYATALAEPQHDSTAQITLLEGSGVSNGKMVANVLCSNCGSWSGGSEDFSSSSASFIYAALSGSPLNSDSLTATIEQHDVNAAFTWQISAAKGGSSGTNPFYAASTTGGKGGKGGKGSSGSGASAGAAIPPTCTPIADSAGPSSTTPTTTQTNNNNNNPSGTACPTTFPASFSTGFPTGTPPAWVQSCFGNNHPQVRAAMATPPPLVPIQPVKRNDGCPAGYESTGASTANPTITSNGLSQSSQQTMILAHGVLACLAFVALFPAGGILIRIANFSGLIWVHAALQMLGYLVYIIAFAIGVYLATTLDYLHKAHPITGIALFVILFFQPILGMLHHKMYKKYGHRTLWSYAHLFHGRVAILLGMVNGGLGIQLANTASSAARIAYAVIVACVAVSYIVIVILGEMRRRRNSPLPNYEKSQKGQQLRDLSSSESDVSYMRQGSSASSAHPLPPPPPPPTYYGRD